MFPTLSFFHDYHKVSETGWIDFTIIKIGYSDWPMYRVVELAVIGFHLRLVWDK